MTRILAAISCLTATAWLAGCAANGPATVPVESSRAAGLLAELRAAHASIPELKDPWDFRPECLRIGRQMMDLDASAVPVLVRALDDREPYIAAVAAVALGRIGDRQAAEPLLARLAYVPPPQPAGFPAPATAPACAWALGRLGEPRAVPLLLRAYWPIGCVDEDIQRLTEPYELRGHGKAYWNLPTLYREAVERIGLPAVPALFAGLNDKSSSVQLAAVHLLAPFGISELHCGVLVNLRKAQAARELSADDEETLQLLESQLMAAELIGRMIGPRLIELLDDETLRSSVADALAHFHVVAAVDRLEELLEQADEDSRGYLLSALDRLRDAPWPESRLAPEIPPRYHPPAGEDQ